MAYEIFDDIAFYYMSTTVLAIITIPWSISKLYTYIHSYIQKQQLLNKQIQLQGKSNINKLLKSEKIYGEGDHDTYTHNKSLFSTSNIIYCVLCLLLIFSLIKLPQYNVQNLATYNPYDILGIDHTSSDKEIQRAYRKLSLIYHPDKNINQTADWDTQFIKISKAYQTLTDPAARENLEKYGNPDGYSGTSITIGLPSFLTEKSNETRILLVYFLLFMVLPPAIVLIWWRTAKSYSETGVLRRTIDAYTHLLTPTLAPKFLIEVLSFSAEFESLQHNATNSADFNTLYSKVKDTMVKQRFFDPTGTKYGGKLAYVGKASVLLHAYMQRIDIPSTLRADLNHILKYSHKLLNCMLEVAIRKGMFQPIRSIVTLMQFITQSMWFDSMPPLMQLPYFDSKMAHQGLQSKVLALPQMIKKSENKDKREKLFPHITNEQWNEIDKVANMLPEIAIDYTVCVEDTIQPNNIYTGDLVLLTVDLYRNIPIPNKSIQNNNDSKSNNNTTQSNKKSPSKQVSDNDERSLLLSNDAKSIEHDDPTDSDDELNADMLNDDELLDQLQLPSKPKSFNDSDAPLVHSLYFPYEKHEKWVILLLEKSSKGIRLAGVGKVPPLHTKQSVELRFLASAEPGIVEYDIIALCDSYIGCDTAKNIKITVLDGNKKPVPKKSDETIYNTHSSAKGWFDDDDDENYDGKWYYFGLATFWELILNIFVLSLLCIFIFNFLVSRGWWGKYVQPVVDYTIDKLHPLWTTVQPTLQPIITPLQSVAVATVTWVSNKLTVEPVKTKYDLDTEQHEYEPEINIDD